MLYFSKDYFLPQTNLEMDRSRVATITFRESKLKMTFGKGKIVLLLYFMAITTLILRGGIIHRDLDAGRLAIVESMRYA